MACLSAFLLSCKKSGLNSATAKKIQFRWSYVNTSSTADYLDGMPLIWTVRQAPAGNFIEFDNDGNMSYIYPTLVTKRYYEVNGDKILHLYAGGTRPTTPQYTDTFFVRHVDDNLLVLFRREYVKNGGVLLAISQTIDSLKK